MARKRANNKMTLVGRMENNTLINKRKLVEDTLIEARAAVNKAIKINKATVPLDSRLRDFLPCPNFIGQTEEGARALAALPDPSKPEDSFPVPFIENVPNNKKTEGLVFRQNIEPGTLINRDTIIKMRIAYHAVT